ncbi:MAG TPA: glycoside hydrolase family 127 protein [Bacteroidales bacterium]|nr:glycoside hydrolase family 127 protein [Bacteroidales bacterium]HRT90093.1 glycoside hydrolase family 127 protein [Bacteroidales bacterium]
MNRFMFLLSAIILIATGCTGKKGNLYYRNNPEPLIRNAYIKLPLGAVKPEGWLKRQLEIQAEGLTGHLDDFWPDLVNSAWRGGEGEAWERGPYYLDGLVPLAYLLEDEKLISKVKGWIEKIIESSTDSGWYGPAKNRDRWPLAVANKVLMQYYEASSDKRALDVLLKYFRYLRNTPPDWPDKDWRGVRAMENAVTGYWLYRQTGEKWITEVIESIQKNSRDWTSYYETFPWDSAAWSEKRIPLNWGPEGLTAHVVNNAMAIKYPGLWYQQSGDKRFRKAVFDGINKYDLNHGQAGGRFSGDEHLSGKSPDRGTELCSVVEYMFSLSELYQIFGINTLADRLEMLAYNSLPGTTTADMWAHQYDQQSNQVLVSVAKRNWSTNRDQSNIYGLMPNFACCLANMHQGWPKFVSGMWMATNDNGLVAVAYGPSSVTAKVGRKGKIVTVTEETGYPFRENIRFIIKTEGKIRFPIYLRIPGWAGSYTLSYKGKIINIKNSPGIFEINEKWSPGDEILLQIPMNVRTERRFNNSMSVLRGPLYFALRIDKEYKSVKLNYDNYGYIGSVDWEIYPRSDWNYALFADPDNPEKSFEVTENSISAWPFADTGDMIWSADSSKYYRFPGEPPVIIRSLGVKLQDWGMTDNSASPPPLSPVKSHDQPESVTLVPYGSARLRITEFPVVEVKIMQDF